MYMPLCKKKKGACLPEPLGVELLHFLQYLFSCLIMTSFVNFDNLVQSWSKLDTCDTVAQVTDD